MINDCVRGTQIDRIQFAYNFKMKTTNHNNNNTINDERSNSNLNPGQNYMQARNVKWKKH